MPIKLAVSTDRHEPGLFHVWCMLDDDSFNARPADRGESFIIGSGPTIPDALEDAQKQLAKAHGDCAVMAFDAGADGLDVIPLLPAVGDTADASAEECLAQLRAVAAFFVDQILTCVDGGIADKLGLAEYQAGLRVRMVDRLAKAINLAVSQEVEGIAQELRGGSDLDVDVPDERIEGLLWCSSCARQRPVYRAGSKATHPGAVCCASCSFVINV